MLTMIDDTDRDCADFIKKNTDLFTTLWIRFSALFYKQPSLQQKIDEASQQLLTMPTPEPPTTTPPQKEIMDHFKEDLANLKDKNKEDDPHDTMNNQTQFSQIIDWNKSRQ